VDIITRFWGDKSAQIPVDDISVLNSQFVPLEKKKKKKKDSHFMEKWEKNKIKKIQKSPSFQDLLVDRKLLIPLGAWLLFCSHGVF
jgi:hypothetical protein